MLTLNQIITQIQVLANAHAQIESNGVGDIHEWQAKPDRIYPVLWIFHERTDISDQYFTYRIRLLSADRVKTGEEGDDTDGHEQEVLSDRQSVLLDFIAYFAQQHTQDYIVERIGSIEPFTERTDDRVAGCSYLLNIKQPWDFAKCSIPQSGATIPPTVDGLTLYDFCDQSVIDRLTPAQVACLQAQYGGSCDPSTITINGSAYGNVPSGGAEDINVTNEGASQVGSLQGGDWVIGNSDVLINAVQVGDIYAEDSLSIAVELDGNPAGSWNAGAQTWEVNSAAYNRLSSKTWLWCYADRALISGYAGNICRFRKTTGGTEFDVAQDANGYADVASVVTNRGADTATMRTVYDQAGTGVNQIQATVGSQPRYAVGSATDYGHTNTWYSQVPFMTVAQSVALNSTFTLYMVVMPSSVAGCMIASSGSSWWVEYTSANNFYVYDGTIYTASSFALQFHAYQLVTIQLKQNALIARVNGVQVLSSGTFTRAATTSFNVGSRVPGGNPAVQGVRACLAHSGDFDANIEAQLIAAYDL